MVVAAMSVALGASGVLLMAQSREPSQAATARTTLHVQAIYDKVEPSVVDVTSTLRYDGETAEGTGVIISAAGALVLTNNHVIRDATKVAVRLTASGRQYPARVVGADVPADVALLQLQGATRLAVATMGNSSAIAAGTPVLAIGNRGGAGGEPADATGVISALGQTIQASDASSGFTETLHDMFQTSAHIAAGYSGGPLANSAGQVIGMNTASGTGAPGANGYAIPINVALAAARLIAAGRAAPGVIIGPHGFLGVVIPQTAATSPQQQAGGDVPPSRTGPAKSHPAAQCLQTSAAAGPPAALAPVRSGALVDGVLCGTGAAAVGLAAGDVITSAAGQPVKSPKELTAIMNGCRPGALVRITWVSTSGARQTRLVRLTAAPAALAADRDFTEIVQVTLRRIRLN
jgi:S1-C subfamily serine protease